MILWHLSYALTVYVILTFITSYQELYFPVRLKCYGGLYVDSSLSACLCSVVSLEDQVESNLYRKQRDDQEVRNENVAPLEYSGRYVLYFTSSNSML